MAFAREIRWMFQVGLVVFLVTIGLGMARGIGLIDFASRTETLTHLHSGTVGWITLGTLASALAMYDRRAGNPRRDVWVTRAAVILSTGAPVYVLAWWTANLPFRAVSGAWLLLGIVMFVGWLLLEAHRIGYGKLSTPQLGVVLGLIALVVGSTLGVVIQVQYASGNRLLPGDPVGAHAETQVSAYLMLVAVSIAYWGLRGHDRTRRGTWMVWLFLLGGAVIALALLAGQFDLALAYFPLALTGLVLFFVLMGERLVRPGWLRRGPERHFAMAAPFALTFFAIFIYVIVGFALLELWADETEVPGSLLAAGAHPLFIGVVTNSLFGVLLRLNADRRSIWPWADDVVFWGVNAALIAFFVVTLVDAGQLYRFVTPVLGLSLLTGIAVHTRRLQSHPMAREVPASAG